MNTEESSQTKVTYVVDAHGIKWTQGYDMERMDIETERSMEMDKEGQI